jgi:uncharacterized tellurite resistance protein B-like protein
VLTKLLDRLRGLVETPDDDGKQLLPIAAATLLLEVAWADQDISEDEIAVIEKALMSQFQLSADAVADIVARSRAEQDESVGVYEFTRTLVEAFDEQQRFELLTHLWRIAYSDASLDRFEEHTIRRISELLYVSHARFIEAKRLARDDSD